MDYNETLAYVTIEAGVTPAGGSVSSAPGGGGGNAPPSSPPGGGGAIASDRGAFLLAN